jgi:hypothetical protein
LTNNREENYEEVQRQSPEAEHQISEKEKAPETGGRKVQELGGRKGVRTKCKLYLEGKEQLDLIP